MISSCLLVIIGATPEGKKESIGFTDGARERAHDWRELLLGLKHRGLTMAPELAIADGGLGFWKALGEVWPTTREQRCWVHNTANVLNKLPKSQQPKAKRALQEIWMAETRNDAEASFDALIETYELKYFKRSPKGAAPIDIGIPEEKREKIAQGLSRLLADSFTLYLMTHNFHWNVTGPMFNTLHAMFMAQYTEQWTALDEIAERIRALGFPAPGTFKEFAKLASIKEVDGVPKAMDMVRHLVAAQEATARTARGVFPQPKTPMTSQLPIC